MKTYPFLFLLSLCLFLTSCGSDEPENVPDGTGEVDDDGKEETPLAPPCGDKVYEVGSIQCSPGFASEEMELVTWNIENFPMQERTIASVASIITDLDADIFALQEIRDVDAFNTLIGQLDGYAGVVVDVRGSIELAYLYKTSEILEISDPIMLFTGDTNPFPREPIEVDVTHVNGLTTKLINIHLKCCDGSEDRRTSASNKLKAYIDDNYPDDEVVILGDWNEDFATGSSFSNFLEDSQNFAFVDLPIYQNNTDDYSYPCQGASFCPSHIDHILITNELCDNLVATNTIRLDDCFTSYLANISDHRPIMVSLKADE